MAKTEPGRTSDLHNTEAQCAPMRGLYRVRVRLRVIVTGVLDRVDRAVARIVAAATSWLAPILLVGVALSIGLMAWLQSARVAVVVGTGAIATAYVAALVGDRMRSGIWRGAATASRVGRYLLALLVLPLFAYIQTQGIERESPRLTAIAVLAAGGVAALAIYRAWPRPSAEAPPIERRSRLQTVGRAAARALPVIAIAALWAGYGYWFSRLAVTNHHALNTRTADLGYYDNIFYQSSHGTFLGCSFVKTGSHVSAHFDPVLALLAAPYRLYPRTEFLLVLQSVWLGAGVVPMYLIGRKFLRSRGAGLALAVMYAAYPALHGANMYEFHSLTLIAPLVLWLLYFFEVDAPLAYYVTLAVLLLCREDVPLLACFVGFYIIGTGRKSAVALGRNTIILSILYFVVVKALFMKSSGILNAGKEAYSYDYYYEAMNPGRTGMSGLIGSMLSNPIFALKTMLDEPKILYLLLLFVPLLFLPFLARGARVMLLYGLLFCLLASRGPVFSIYFQYSTVIFPIAFAVTPIALQQLEQRPMLAELGIDGRRLSRALLGGALVATLLLSWKFGGAIDNRAFHGGFGGITRKLTEGQRAAYEWVDAQASSIPRRASVGATKRLGPHVSNRRDVYFWPDRGGEDYVFADESELRGAELDRHTKAIGNEYDEVSRLGKMALFKRRPR